MEITVTHLAIAEYAHVVETCGWDIAFCGNADRFGIDYANALDSAYVATIR